MKKHVVVAFLGLLGGLNAVAQRDSDAYENDRRYCASGRSGVDFNSCMRQLRHERDRYERDRYERDRYERDQYERREYDRRQPAEPPRLSDMQQRALNNCAMLLPRDQPRCRATVMSTVR